MTPVNILGKALIYISSFVRTVQLSQISTTSLGGLFIPDWVDFSYLGQYTPAKTSLRVSPWDTPIESKNTPYQIHLYSQNRSQCVAVLIGGFGPGLFRFSQNERHLILPNDYIARKATDRSAMPLAVLYHMHAKLTVQ